MKGTDEDCCYYQCAECLAREDCREIDDGVDIRKGNINLNVFFSSVMTTPVRHGVKSERKVKKGVNLTIYSILYYAM